MPLKAFVEHLNHLAPGSATISGMKRRCETGRLPAQKNGRAWMVVISSPEARAFVNEAQAKRDAKHEVNQVAGLEANLRTAHEVNQQLSARFDAMVESNQKLRNRVAELEQALKIAEAKLEIAMTFSGVKPKVKVKNAPGIDWAARYREWSLKQDRPTITRFSEEMGVPRTTVSAAVNRAKRDASQN
ncbi:hypothetical protein [Bifidobacterium pseudolongum]|nr:hypothetical protein [Bifidobacterium pseudolongum]